MPASKAAVGLREPAMQMRRPRDGWIGSGWKMNMTLGEARGYASALRDYIAQHDPGLNVFVVPPFTALDAVREALRGSTVYLGAQNMHWCEHGPYTGEISPVMLTDVGVRIVELGHSERRAGCGETDVTVNRKVLAALRHGLRPLICVGESASERDLGVAAESVARQVMVALAGVPAKAAEDVLLAYEPVWAIGESGIPAEPVYAARMHEVIRAAVSKVCGARAAACVPVLYGGSVDPGNVPAFAAEPSLDGLFIGRASWQVASFVACIEAFQNGRRQTVTA
jgi:triosephosphate isomerase